MINHWTLQEHFCAWTQPYAVKVPSGDPLKLHSLALKVLGGPKWRTMRTRQGIPRGPQIATDFGQKMWPGDPFDAKRLAAHTVRPEGPGMLRTRHCHHLSRFNLKFHSKPSNYTHMIEEFVMWLCRFWVNEYIYIYYIHTQLCISNIQAYIIYYIYAYTC